jgi:hypothetical protein
VKPAGYANSKMVKNLIVGQKLSDWQAISKFLRNFGKLAYENEMHKIISE